ncbi:MAG: Rnf-Nqr domain containing protein [Gammaproteobacteria bacterium]
MTELALVVIAAALVNNLVLVQTLGVDALFGASDRVEMAIGTAFVTGVVLMITAVLTQVVERYVLVPLELPYLRLIAFVVVVAVTVHVAGIVVRRASPLTKRMLDVPATVVTANSAVLGVALLNSTASRSLVAALCYGIGAAIGFGLALILFAGLRERLAHADVPVPFRGAAIAFVTAGIVSLAFLGFAGFARL